MSLAAYRERLVSFSSPGFAPQGNPPPTPSSPFQSPPPSRRHSAWGSGWVEDTYDDSPVDRRYAYSHIPPRERSFDHRGRVRPPPHLSADGRRHHHHQHSHHHHNQYRRSMRRHHDRTRSPSYSSSRTRGRSPASSASSASSSASSSAASSYYDDYY